MEYSRPDVDGLCKKITDLSNKISTPGEDFSAQLSELQELNVLLENVYTMRTLSEIHFYIDTGDAKWADETDYFAMASAELSKNLEALYIACADSENCSRFEAECFGEGFLEPYKGQSGMSDRELQLLQREASLLNEYTAYDYDRIFDAYGTDYDAMYKKINSDLGSLMVELVKIRKETARLRGYDNYIDYAYDSLSRDYTPDEARALLDGIVEKIVPIFTEARNAGKYDNDGSLPRLSAGRISDVAREGLKKLDKRFIESLDFMEKYNLYYLGYDSKQADVSFTTYLFSYDAPYMLIHGAGDMYDLMTFIHEFGHFTDNYYNYGSNFDIDQSEIASQALEMLFLCNADGCGLSEYELASLEAMKFADTLTIYVIQGMYYRFEDRLYALPDDELTLEKINGLANEVLQEFGLTSYYSDFPTLWVTVPHFFESAFYVISYITSNSAALEIYETELAGKGSGVDLYFALINWDHEKTFRENLSRVSMRDPFSGEAVDNLAKTLKAMMLE